MNATFENCKETFIASELNTDVHMDSGGSNCMKNYLDRTKESGILENSGFSVKQGEDYIFGCDRILWFNNAFSSDFRKRVNFGNLVLH